jgi:hypothetical protein
LKGGNRRETLEPTAGFEPATREGEDGEGSVQPHEQEGKRGRGERADVVGDALVRVRDLGMLPQAEVRRVLQVTLHEPARHPVPPQEAQALLGEAVDHRGDGRDCEDADVERPHAQEAGHAVLLDGGHEVAADVAVHHVQAVDREQQREQRAQQQLHAGADLGAQVVQDGAAPADPGQPVERDPRGLHSATAPRAVSARDRRRGSPGGFGPSGP